MNRLTDISTAAAQKLDDHDAIIAVIRAETVAFLNADFDSWAECWLHNDRAQDVFTSPATGLTVVSGWQRIAENMKHVIQTGMVCPLEKIKQENHKISVTGDTAWVVYDGLPVDGTGAVGLNFETRILERTSGVWKIVYSSVMIQHESKTGNREISVDHLGRVVLADFECLEKLKTHPVLTISAGRLRARRGDWDKILQKEIARAGKYHGFFELFRFSSETGGPLHYPAVLGNTDDGGVAVVIFSVRDCATYLCIDAEEVIDRRLNVAQAVFGISDGQMRLARRIAAGEGLKQSAEALDISVNTARTHIARIFEKTGVKSQTALVRLLLSVG